MTGTADDKIASLAKQIAIDVSNHPAEVRDRRLSELHARLVKMSALANVPERTAVESADRTVSLSKILLSKLETSPLRHGRRD